MNIMSVATGDAEVDEKVNEWLKWDKNEKTRGEICALASKQNVAELRKRLCNRLEFGTAGLRARMGAGYSMMSDLTIIQTTQGLLKYAEKDCPNLKKRGVVVGYDARHNSERWAWMTACVFLNADVPVFLYSKINPTPFVPYGVLHFGCDVGIMITASHNPKEDNGYKVYWSNGAQIIPPHDAGIASSILANLEPWPSSWDTSVVSSHPLRTDPYEEVMTTYFKDISSLCKHREQNAQSPVKFAYTAMHGVGHIFSIESFKTFGFQPFVPVKEQVDPDPEFPTVKFPNPEEGKSALNLSFKTADENGCTVILANDPDADRLAVAEKQPGGQWHVFTGNEIGALLGWWFIECHRNHRPDELGPHICMLSSTVSSKILRTLAEKEGFMFEDTLTGFKWMGNRSHELQKEGKEVVFAFEEAIGFMCGTMVLDKDGVSSLGCMAECATYLARKGSTLSQQLKNIYDVYGIHKSNNSYFICHKQPVIQAIFERMRNFDGPGKYPSKCGQYDVKYVRDLTTGYDNSYEDCKARLPVSASSQMITFTLANGCVATIRTSGTEPKIKYYTEYRAPPELSADDVEKDLHNMVDCIINHFLEPEKNGLVPKAD